MAPDSLPAAEAVETPRLTLRRLHEIKCGIGAPPSPAERRAAEQVRRRVAEQLQAVQPALVGLLHGIERLRPSIEAAVAAMRRPAPRRAAPARRPVVHRPVARQRPREHRRTSRRSGARAPGRPSADADADSGGPPLRLCAACGEPFRPRRSDSSYCYSADCQRRRTALKVRRHRARRDASLPAWARAEARAVACVRAGAASPEQALVALVLGLARRGALVPAEALR